MSRETLLKHLIANGKTNDKSWDQLSEIHKIKDGEKARQIWKLYRASKEYKEGPKVTRDSLITNWVKLNQSDTPNVKSSKILSNKESLLEISIPDLHIGKMSWDKETGEDYDIEIASKRFKDAVENFINEVPLDRVERILLPLGNDLLNVDNKMNTTTSGTPQSSDSRFGKMFKAVKNLMVDTIDKLSLIAPVDVLIVPGNHDEATMFTLGELLDAWYRESKVVKIFNSPKLRKYYEYGKNMIMFTHGDKEKHGELGQIAAHEEALMWGRTKYREVHLGHLHKSKTIAYTTGDEYPGFKIRILPSLCAADAWHYANGYLSSKAAKAFLWDKEKGLTTEYTYNL